MIESENCISIPKIALKDYSVLGRTAFCGKPNENRSHSAPSLSTPNFVRGVSTRWIAESISSKLRTALRGPRSTSPSPTYVASAVNSPESGHQLLLSSAKVDAAIKRAAQLANRTDCSAERFTC